jgi:hypothetical protein
MTDSQSTVLVTGAAGLAWVGIYPGLTEAMLAVVADALRDGSAP